MTFLLQVLTFRREPILENNLTSLIEHSHNALEHDRRLRYTDEFLKCTILYLYNIIGLDSKASTFK